MERKKLPKSKERLKNMTREQIQEALKRKKEGNAKALEIVETFIDDVQTEEIFLSKLFDINQSHYQDIVEERSILKRCGYPLCGHQLVNIPKKQFHISTLQNRVFDITERKNFCSNHCFKCSNFIKDQLLTSPLWMRDTEKCPDFKLFSNPISGKDITGHEIDLGHNRIKQTDIEQKTTPTINNENISNNIEINEHINNKIISNIKEINKLHNDQCDNQSVPHNHKKLSNDFNKNEIHLNNETKIHKETNESISNEHLPINKINEQLKGSISNYETNMERLETETKININKNVINEEKIITSNNNINEIENKSKLINKKNLSETLQTVNINRKLISEEINKNEIIENILPKNNKDKNQDNIKMNEEKNNLLKEINEIKITKPIEIKTNEHIKNTKQTLENIDLNKEQEKLENIKDEKEKLENLNNLKLNKVKRINESGSTKTLPNEQSKINKVDSTTNNIPKSPNKQNEINEKNKILNKILFIEKCLKQWITLDTLIYIYGEHYVQNIIKDKNKSNRVPTKTNMATNESNMVTTETIMSSTQTNMVITKNNMATTETNMASIETNMMANTLHKNLAYDKYLAICRKLNMLELLDDKEDEKVLKHKPEQPIPDYEKLKKETDQLLIKVNDFYQGDKRKVTFAEEIENKQENDETTPSVILPPVDLHAQNALRRRILMDKLARIVPEVLRLLGASHLSLTSDLRNLIRTFRLSAHNIMFQSAEWNLITLVFLKLLSIRDPCLKEMFSADISRKHLILISMSYNLDPGYLDRLLMWLMDTDYIIENY